MIVFMEKYILDANLFFNMESGLDMGEKTEEVVVYLTEIGRKLKKKKMGEFFMPPRVVEEFLSFFEKRDKLFIKNFLSVIRVKSPDVGKLNLPANIFYKLIDDIRARSYRGLNIGEEEIEKAGRLMLGKKELSTKDFQVTIGSVIKKFRERYRQATRFGFLDSLADLDLIVLTKELNGALISSDEGVIHWGRFFGVRETPVEVWQKQLLDLLEEV